MTYQSLFDSAKHAVCEGGSGGDTSDYAERAPYLLANFVGQSRMLDTQYRAAHQMDAGTYPEVAAVSMTDTFPLCAVFAPLAVYYLSAMLVLDENEEMSEKFFSLYADGIAALEDSLPAKIESIVNRYPGLFG